MTRVSRRFGRLDPVGAVVAVAAVAAAVYGLASGLSLQPDYTDRLRDDAFYEFAWAANVAAGNGPMVSDGVTTSGVQLLWSLMLVPLALCFGAGSLPLLAPWLGLLLHFVAAALIAFRGDGAGRDRLGSVCVALCWLGNPLLIREAQNGQETALACLMVVWLWQDRRASTWRFGLLGVLSVFARTDLLAFVAALGLLRIPREGWRALATPLLALGLLVLCCSLLGGGALPDSGAPMAWLWHGNHAATDPPLAETLATYWWYLRPVLFGGPWALASAFGVGLAVFAAVRPWWPRALRALPAVLVAGAALLGAGDLIVAGWTALGLALLPAPARRRVPWDVLALLLAGAAVLTLHWAVRWYPRDYYVAPLVVVAVAAALRLARLRLLLLVLAIAQIVDSGRVLPEPLLGQRAMAMAGHHLAEVLPAGERVGSFNSGLVTFGADVMRRGQAARRAVVNLDGVVDARAFAALRQGRLGAWLDEQGIRFVIDNPLQFSRDPSRDHANGLWIAPDFAAERDLVECARFATPGAASFRLYWRVGRGAMPEPQRAARDLGPFDGGRCVLWPARAGQQLEIETAAGGREALLAVDVDTVAIVFVGSERHGTGRLFVTGEPAPVLTLSRL